ncbi:MAG: hypothetical protein ACRDR6_14070 [Pseudonocardiaceae bacterium]
MTAPQPPVAALSSSRGIRRHVVWNQLAITLGTLVSYLVDYGLAATQNWRLMYRRGDHASTTSLDPAVRR